MADDLNFKIEAEGGEEARREIRRTASAGESAGRTLEQSFQKDLVSAQAFTAGLGSMVAAMAMVSKEADRYHAKQQQYMETWRRNQKAFLDTLFLGDNLKDPKFRERVRDFAKRSERQFPEASQGLYTLQSKGGKLTNQQLAALQSEIEQQAPTTTMTLSQLSTLYTKLGAIPGTEGFDANVIQNIATQFAEKAAISGPGEAEMILPRALSVGLKSGLSHRRMAGLLSEATQVTATGEQAATGIEQLARNLMGGKGEQRGLKGDLLARMQQVAKMKLSTADLDELMGESGARLAPLLTDIAGVTRRVGEFERATGSDRDIVGRKLALANKNSDYVANRILNRQEVQRDLREEKRFNKEEAIALGGQEQMYDERGYGETHKAVLGFMDRIALWMGVITPEALAGGKEDLQELRDAQRAGAADAERERAKLETGF